MIQQKLKEKSDCSYNVDIISSFLNKQHVSSQKYDVIFVDEAQYLVSSTSDLSSLKSVLESGTVIVFLQDNTQIIDGDKLGEFDWPQLASTYNKLLSQYYLNRSLRYAGKGSGIHWLAHQFQIADTGNYEEWDNDAFQICVVDTPQDLLNRIETKNREGKSSRVLVRYDSLCDLKYDEILKERYYTIPEYDFQIPVYTPEGELTRAWYSDNQYSGYATSPYAIMGLDYDYDYVGVIIGKELGYDKDSGLVILNNSAINDNNMAARLIKMTYYVLLSKGMNGVYIFIQDNSLKEMIIERLNYSTRRFEWIKELADKYRPDIEKTLIDRQNQKSSYSYAMYVYEVVNEFLASLKQFTKDQLDGAQYKKISDQCSQLLLELQSNLMTQAEIRDKYQMIIIRSMGESAWDKLSETGQKCLISAELTYHDMKEFNQLYDFSSVCVQVSKAVEYELTKRFYCEYVKYLEVLYDRTTYPNIFYSKVPRSIMKQERGRNRLLKEEEVTLGSIPFVVGLNMDGRITDQEAYNAFKDYASNHLLESDLDIRNTLAKHITYIIRIKNDYRNKAAHKNPMDVITAKACLDYVIEVQRTLGKMLDDYKF